ncbi:MAG: hypothetical protein ACFFBT_12870 [Promethearchaeota archaeon]
MVQEVMVLKLPASMEAAELEQLLVEKLQIPREDVQVVEVKRSAVKLRVKKKIKKKVLRLINKHAKYHEELINIRQLADRYGFLNYFRVY